MRRGRERLSIVQELQHDLARHRPDSGRADATEIDPDELRIIADMERAQIIEERRSSLRAASKDTPVPGYTVQQSRRVLDAKARLDPETSRRVQDQIYELMDDPLGDSEPDSDTGMRRIRIRETPLEVGYEVEETTQRVRIVFLEQTGQAGAGGIENG